MDVLRQSTGRIFDVQRFSLHDGHGIRTTVFFQGCPLRCRWCHNPEGLEARPMLSYLAQHCSACGACASVCRQGVHAIQSGVHRMDRSRCTACGACTGACTTGALEMVGRTACAGEIIDEVRKDEAFYRNSGGGMTVSGGEPTQQIDFLEALLKLARHHAIHTAVETCGHAPRECYQRLLPLVDHFLFDLKETDAQRHIALTGVSNALILSNLHYLHDAGSSIHLRLPLVPGVNDGEDHFHAIAALLQQLTRLGGVELVPYHNFGQSKRERFGFPSGPLVNVASADRQTISAWQARFSALGVNANNGV